MITEYAGGDQAATVTTEHFLSSPNVQGTFELTVDLNVMQAGDVVTLRAYKMAKAAGTQRVIWAKTFYGVQLTDAAVVQSGKILNTLTDANAVRFSLLQDFGTSRTFSWQVHKDDALTPATSGRTAVVDTNGLIDANAVKVGPTGAGTAQTAGDLKATLGTPAGASLAADLVVIDNFVDDLESRVVGTIAAGTHNPQSGDAFARLGAPAGASVSADVAAVKVDTAAILVDTGTTLDGRIPAALTADGNIKADTLRVGGTLQTAGDLAALITTVDNLLDTEVQAIFDRLGAPAGASMSADVAAIKADAVTLLARIIGTLASGTHNPQTGDSFARIGAAGASLTDLGGMSTTMKGQVNAEVVDVEGTDTLPDSYAADGAQPTTRQAILAILQVLTEITISGTTMTVKKPDGSTTAMTFTLNSATDPTSVTRAS